MQNLIIIDDNIPYIQKIIGGISNSINNIKIYNFYTPNNTNLLKIVNDREIDIIIINIESAGTDIIRFIQENNIDTYIKSIIILYNDINNIKKIIIKEYEKYIFKCVRMLPKIDNLIKIVRKLTYLKENTYNKTIFRNKVERVVKKIGYDLTDIGSQYIIESIEYLYQNNIEYFKLNDIYNMLSQRHTKSINTIKGDMMQATKKMRKYCCEDIILDYFNYQELVEMPTIKEIIATINDNI